MNKTNKKGIVLVEALIAIAVLAVSAGIVSFVINSANKNLAESREQLMFESFFSEAVEMVTNVVDSNSLIRPEGNEAIYSPDCLFVINPLETADFNRPCSDFVQFEAGTKYVPTFDENENLIFSDEEGLGMIYQLPSLKYAQMSNDQALLLGAKDTGYTRFLMFDSLDKDNGEASFTVTLSHNGNFFTRSYNLFK
jgi:type II secretory pathway pseudopilin PulG